MGTPLPEPAGAVARVVAGNVYLPAPVCELHLPGIEAIALMVRDGAALIVPLTRDSAGGLLLKRRNARGDRVIHAQEFFRTQGYLENFEAREVPLRWRDELAALELVGLPRSLAADPTAAN